ncbi:hypothetical protein A3D88_02545 [Candidatus Peribacteria bacterium RIFCSPHIGHO2_02_FULL_52_16]|nr:MAG: hypothetical protein A2706_00370 [Candidatus Peribacteria bacterium RIFCSPHIGHO2_01_FULL_51_35]OGJ61641.1 MAG: hypothetical protein A3D88_02545 [Candidatus Peribacteria bacterium RIFCSPHIGHO2_02_FULL_52_16]
MEIPQTFARLLDRPPPGTDIAMAILHIRQHLPKRFLEFPLNENAIHQLEAHKRSWDDLLVEQSYGNDCDTAEYKTQCEEFNAISLSIALLRHYLEDNFSQQSATSAAQS